MPTDLLILLALLAAAALFARVRQPRAPEVQERLVRLTPRAADRLADPRAPLRIALLALTLAPLLLLALVLFTTLGEPLCEIPRPGKSCEEGAAHGPLPALLLLFAALPLLFVARRELRPEDPSGSARELPLLPLLLLPLLACAPAPGPHLDPSALDFSPQHSERTLYLVNPGPEPVQLRDVRLDTQTPDWGSFVIQERSIPPVIPPGAEIALHLAAEPENFRDPSRPRERHYRAGHSRLLFDIDGAQQRLPLNFAGAPEAGLPARLAALVALLLLLLALSAALRLRAIPPTFILALALFPFADALCLDELTAARSARDLARCAEGYGGAAFQLLHIDGALILWLAALMLAPLARLAAAPQSASPPAEVRLIRRQITAALTLILAATAALLGHGTLAPRALILAQHPPLMSALPGWGLLLQPLAAAAFLWAAASRRPPGQLADRADRLDDLALAALFVLLFAGGWQLPFAPPRLPHAVDLLLQVGVSLSKIALVDLLQSRLRRHLSRDHRGLTRPLVLAFIALAAALLQAL
ncbi:MAG: hypothetical protein IPK80_32025 [Nannocystis sp.]|nr:hypothetical protein [Nannocystis sp.]